MRIFSNGFYTFFHVWLLDSRLVRFLNDCQSRREVEDSIPPRRDGRPHYLTPRCASRFKRRGLERGARGIRVPTICSRQRHTPVVRCSLFLVYGAGVTVLNVRLMHLRSPRLASGTPWSEAGGRARWKEGRTRGGDNHEQLCRAATDDERKGRDWWWDQEDGWWRSRPRGSVTVSDSAEWEEPAETSRGTPDAQILAISLYHRDIDFSVRLVFVDLDLDLLCLLSESDKL